MKIKLFDSTPLIIEALKANLVPMLHGSPAIGKSAVISHIAKQFNLKVIDLRLSQCEPTDLMGFPNLKGERSSYLPMDYFPIEGDPIPEGYSGWLLFLDEFSSVANEVQAAAYKLILDRMVGNHPLHKKVAIAAAGNLETDGAIVNPMSTALASRLIHLEVEFDRDGWLLWANGTGIDHRITSYLGFRPDNGYTFKPDSTDYTYASPRTWEFLNRIINGRPLTKSMMALYAGTVGEGVARDFFGYCQIHQELPSVEQIAAKPNSTPVPTEPSIQHAITGAIAANTTKENIASLMEYLCRLPPEFQITGVRSIVKRNPKIIKEPCIAPWIVKFANDLL